MRVSARPRIDKFKFYDVVVYASRASHSARTLATALGSRRWRDDLPERYRRRRPYFRGNSSPMVLNWGSTVHPDWLEDPRFRLSPVWVNRAEGTRRAVNKLEFFNAVSGIEGVPTLRWTSDQGAASEWLAAGHKVVARRSLTGSSGAGLTVVEPGETLVAAPLYTRYYPKTHEFRVHVFNGQVIDFTQKKLRVGASSDTESNRVVRSLANGWVHAHGDIDLDEPGKEQMGRASIACVAGLGLDFGAVDVLAILRDAGGSGPRPLKNFAICEVNTGPGLENSQTIKAYADAILRMRSAA